MSSEKIDDTFYSLDMTKIPPNIDPLEDLPIFEWYAAHSSTTTIPTWVTHLVDPQY